MQMYQKGTVNKNIGKCSLINLQIDILGKYMVLQVFQ